MRRLRCRLGFRGPCIIAPGPRATFSAFIPVGSGFGAASHGFFDLSARKSIAI
jgi:hypothetical protein